MMDLLSTSTIVSLLGIGLTIAGLWLWGRDDAA